MESQEESSFLFVGNALWLDFVNTQIVKEGQIIDLLQSPADLLDWLAQANVLSAEEAKTVWTRELQQQAVTRGTIAKEGAEGARTLQSARGFRAALRETAGLVVAGKPIPAVIVETINSWLYRSQTHSLLAQTADGYALREVREWERLEDALALVAMSAAELLARGDRTLVRKCENPQCILYFYDTTKNHARRWCSMSGCGNRAKAAAHYQRRRQAERQD